MFYDYKYKDNKRFLDLDNYTGVSLDTFPRKESDTYSISLQSKSNGMFIAFDFENKEEAEQMYHQIRNDFKENKKASDTEKRLKSYIDDIDKQIAKEVKTYLDNIQNK